MLITAKKFRWTEGENYTDAFIIPWQDAAAGESVFRIDFFFCSNGRIVSAAHQYDKLREWKAEFKAMDLQYAQDKLRECIDMQNALVESQRQAMQNTDHTA